MIDAFKRDELIQLVCSIVLDCGNTAQKFRAYEREVVSVDGVSREIKARADTLLETELIEKLADIGYPILSEEKGLVQGHSSSNFRFVIDPLDGTYNFMRDLGHYSISVAFCLGVKPIFGVIYDIQSNTLYWGGADIPSRTSDGMALGVSTLSDGSRSCVLTGIPANMNTEDLETLSKFWQRIQCFSKIRMLGCASMSLVQIALGRAECYFEYDIMFWDVAAGLALVEGAGGSYKCVTGTKKHSVNVTATNGNSFFSS
jgi:myo-inositol-1(or 4)-monophosphatase